MSCQTVVLWWISPRQHCTAENAAFSHPFFPLIHPLPDSLPAAITEGFICLLFFTVLLSLWDLSPHFPSPLHNSPRPSGVFGAEWLVLLSSWRRASVLYPFLCRLCRLRSACLRTSVVVRGEKVNRSFTVLKTLAKWSENWSPTGGKMSVKRAKFVPYTIRKDSVLKIPAPQEEISRLLITDNLRCKCQRPNMVPDSAPSALDTHQDGLSVSSAPQTCFAFSHHSECSHVSFV